MTTAEYFVDPVADFLDDNALRYVADGLPLQEVVRARRHLTSWDEWWPYWMDRSSSFETYADRSESSVATRSAMSVLSMLCAHLAQYLHFHATEERATALRRKVDVYREAAADFDPPSREVAIASGSHEFPGYLRVPATTDRPIPCVVYVGGLDAHKEDAHGFVELCLARGCAVLAFDGPGQGEALLRGIHFDGSAHEVVGAAVAAAAAVPEIDGERIGVVGRSLGGYLAPRATADRDDIRALAVWGAMYDLANYHDLPGHTRAGFRAITEADTDEDAAERLRVVSMEGHAQRITCPTLIVHGGDDRLTPPDGAERMASEVGAECELRLLEGSPHCNHDLAHLVRPALADWLASSLA